MTAPDRCPTCDAPLPPGVEPAGCPRCLLGAGLPGAGDAAVEGPGDAAQREAIAAQFPELEVLEVIGRGGMGVVYRVRQRALDRLAALKVLPEELHDEPGFAERFAREARTMARLDHPHIVRVHDFGERDDRFFLLMEYVDGASLRRVIDAGGLEAAEALRIVPPICQALQYAHDQGVVHRDIKPGNVLIGTDGSVKVTDFGLAKLLHHDPSEHTLTQVGQVMGTPHYMAPEQYRTPDDVDHRADIYSLGVVFYEMLTGEVPMGNFEPPSSRVELDVRLDQVVLRTLSRERERRYQRADELRTEVATIVERPEHAARAALTDDKPRPAPRLSRLALWGFLCLPAAFVLPILLGTVLGAMLAWAPLAVAGILGFLLLVAGFFLSLAGWIQIARSRGALKGLGFAVTGTLAPLPLFLMGVAFLFLGVRDVPHVESGDIDRSTAPVARHAVWDRLTDAFRDGTVQRDELPTLVADVDRRRVDLLRREDREHLARKGLLGPVFLPRAKLPEDMAAYARQDWSVAASGEPRATLAVSHGSESLTLQLLEGDGHWTFALAPVLRTPEPQDWPLADLVEGLYTGAIEPRATQTEVEILWSIYRRFWEAGDMPRRARVPLGHVSAVLAPSHRARRAFDDMTTVSERGQDGSLGLLFLDAAALPVPLDAYALARIEVARDGTAAQVSARSAESEIRFGVVREGGRWWLAGDPASVVDR